MPLMVFAAGLVGGAVVIRWALGESQRINRELEEARIASLRETAAIRTRTLRPDPRTGVYRPD